MEKTLKKSAWFNSQSQVDAVTSMRWGGGSREKGLGDAELDKKMAGKAKIQVIASQKQEWGLADEDQTS